MLLSIIIPMYNAESYISQCLDSILSQCLDLDKYEIIIVNYGSTDSSQEIVQEYQKRFHNIRLFDQINKGQSAARNLGMDNASGDYIQFIDADDFILPDSLVHILSFVETTDENNKYDIITFDIAGGDANKSNSIKDYGSGKCIWTGNGYEYIASHNYNNSPCYYWLNRDYANRIILRFVEGQLCEDGMFTLTALLNSNNVAYIDFLVYFYAVRPQSTTTTINPERMKKIVKGFDYAVKYITKLLELHPDMGELCKKRVITRRDSYVFFLFIRLLKMGDYDGAKATIIEYENLKLYPLKHFIGQDYFGVKYRVLNAIVNCKFLYLSLCRLNNLLKDEK